MTTSYSRAVRVACVLCGSCQHTSTQARARDTAALNTRATILEEEACAPPASCMAKG